MEEGKIPKGFKPPSEPSKSEKPRPLSWRERKTRCKLGLHANPTGKYWDYPYLCKFCGDCVGEPPAKRYHADGGE
ncbi:MAG TPA: hypothetical protein ENH95_00750 [Nitrosopumilus sp.]|nr:hypothetical protein [Nitrosopumilus sp.]